MLTFFIMFKAGEQNATHFLARQRLMFYEPRRRRPQKRFVDDLDDLSDFFLVR